MTAARPRIALVGPTHPATGGIVHFTAGLAEALRAEADVLLVGWTRRYPARLYPGSLEDDVSATAIGAAGAEPLLDLLDPRSWRRALARVRAHGAEALVLQWVHPIHAPVYRALAAGCRRAGIRVVMVCHNVEPHESSAVWRRLTRVALGAADELVVHAAALVPEAQALAPGRPVVPGFLPHFGNVAEGAGAASAAEVAAVRARYGALDGRRLLLSFGYVRPYKGVEDAIHAMAHVRADAVLAVVGECWDDDAPYRAAIAAAGVDERVRLDLRFVGNDELPALFGAADAVVLPYRAASQSGVAALALGFERPVVATAVGGLPELVDDGATGALVPPRDPPALAAAIDRVLADASDRGAAYAAARERLSWRRYAALLLDAARSPVAHGVDAGTHAVLDVASRRAKAAKILRLVEARRPLAGARVLDVGTGSGTIAAALAAAAGHAGAVTSVDIADVRVDRDGYRFVRAEGVELPFPHAAFDVALSNHVIEHVGDAAAQAAHLRELARVLALGGLLYLAVPHRYRLVENHYRLPLLSWLPPRLADLYVRLARRGERYDCRLLARGELARLVAAAGLRGEDATREALDATLALEGGRAARLLARLPGPGARSSPGRSRRRSSWSPRSRGRRHERGGARARRDPRDVGTRRALPARAAAGHDARGRAPRAQARRGPRRRHDRRRRARRRGRPAPGRARAGARGRRGRRARREPRAHPRARATGPRGRAPRCGVPRPRRARPADLRLGARRPRHGHVHERGGAARRPRRRRERRAGSRGRPAGRARRPAERRRVPGLVPLGRRRAARRARLPRLAGPARRGRHGDGRRWRLGARPGRGRGAPARERARAPTRAARRTTSQARSRRSSSSAPSRSSGTPGCRRRSCSRSR